MSRQEHSLVVCEECGQPHRWRALEAGSLARCVRCEAIIGRGHRLPITGILALTITAGVAFVIGISTQVMSLSLRGRFEGSTLPQAIVATWNDGQEIVAVVAALTALVAPALFIALRLYVLVPLASGRKPRGFAFCVRLLHHVGHWNLVQVFTIGVLLSLVRLANMADAGPGPGLFALGAVTFLFAAIESAGLKHLWWQLP